MKLKTDRIRCLYNVALAILTGFLVGCHPEMAEISAADRTRYLMREDGVLRNFSVAEFPFSSGFPAPGNVLYLLVEQVPNETDRAAIQSAFSHSRPIRILGGQKGDLVHAVSDITHGIEPTRTRWIVANSPLIVAIGSERKDPASLSRFDVENTSDFARIDGGRVTLGRFQKLITAADLDQMIDGIVISSSPSSIGQDPESLSKSRLIISFPQPVLLRQLIEDPKRDFERGT